MSPCCWRSTTENGYTWWPMRWKGAWTTRSHCRTSTARWRRSTWSTGWRRASSAASVLSRCVRHVPGVGSQFYFPCLLFVVGVTLQCVFCLPGEGEHPQVHRRSEVSGQNHSGCLGLKGGAPPPAQCSRRHLHFSLQNKLFPLKGCLCVQYLHVSWYKINILLFILKRLQSYFPFWLIQSWVSMTVLRAVTCFTATLGQTAIASGALCEALSLRPKDDTASWFLNLWTHNGSAAAHLRL